MSRRGLSVRMRASATLLWASGKGVPRRVIADVLGVALGTVDRYVRDRSLPAIGIAHSILATDWFTIVDDCERQRMRARGRKAWAMLTVDALVEDGFSLANIAFWAGVHYSKFCTQRKYGELSASNAERILAAEGMPMRAGEWCA